jgi:serine/threonine protein kinase
VVETSPIWVKLGDFGIAKRTHNTSTTTFLRTAVGTQDYAAPEVLGYLESETSEYTNAVDIWSLGCVVYDILAEEKPFKTPRKCMRYCEGDEDFPDVKMRERQISDAGIRFIKRLLAPQPNDRPIATEAAKDPWLQEPEIDNLKSNVTGPSKADTVPMENNNLSYLYPK